MSSETETSSSSDPPPERCCSSSPGSSLTELKLYQAFIFSVPIVFTFVLLFSFYLFYLRRRRADWVSLRMRASRPIDGQNVDVPRPEVGLRKELREMLPVIVYKESFSVNDSQFVKKQILRNLSRKMVFSTKKQTFNSLFLKLNSILEWLEDG
ncbi:RING-H2 finger protein ATL58 isoform X2 [Rhodamnia argentea]|uniref:RING-H2 finger protein ATL58 isoform X2 n=1 Tax=Rhodamnia argentea TaxID=178133 RepID=A0A8B8QU36_9MYRT|nr:RING-H2 finger protein ATL58 isoform X2 [Rhodamnia argentea]